MPPETDPNLIVGRENSEDAGVYRLTDEIALIQTVDFFTPIVNDPRDFGRIAAANALSDVYAMGGRPVTAMNIVCFPVRQMDKNILKQILLGGMEKVHEAGAALAGGHSIEDPEVKYGLSVTGIAHPDRILTNSGARSGDVLLLTKPLGTGIISTAVKGGLASAEVEKLATEVMAALNRKAAEIMAEVYDYAAMGLVPAGSYSNRSFCAAALRNADRIDPLMLDILSDAQTSGGLLIAVPESEAEILLSRLLAGGVEAAAIVGRVTGRSEGIIELVE